MKRIKEIFKKALEKNVAWGSIRATFLSYKELLFNLKATVLHLWNYYFNKRLKNFKKLNIGCGTDYKEGFLNIDLNDMADVFLDARNKLPFENDTIDYIYSSHFVEHLEHHELMTHLHECHRILSLDGVLRIAVPNFEKAMKAYLDRDMERLEIVKNRFPLNLNSIKGIDEDLICYMDYLNRGIHEYGQHKILLDFEKIKNMLIACGFEANKIFLSDFDDSIDLSIRDYASFYVVASK